MIKLFFKDSELKIEKNTPLIEIVKQLNLTEPHVGLGIFVNGELKDFSYVLQDQDHVEVLSFDDPMGKKIFWHTSAHVLAQAILRLFPDATPTIGPPIEEGFYYDFANLHISIEDFPKIEKEIKAVLKENFKSEKLVFASKKEAIDAFKGNPYKKEIIQEIPDGESLTAYRQGEFFDLCRGPHLYNLGKIKAFKLLKVSGAYWRGKS